MTTHFNTVAKMEVSLVKTISASTVARWIQKTTGKKITIEQTGDVISWDETKLSTFENQQLKNYLLLWE